jgi:hypothetical protein
MRILTIALLAATAGCASSGFPDVVDVREVPTTFGPPSISHIRDVGAVRLPQTGAWKGEPDGVAGPGELLVIEGDNFGRLPTVSIGGRATTIVARTAGGGIVARVPVGVPVGTVPIVVSQPRGRAQKTFPIRRFAVVAHNGQLTFMKVDRDRAEPVGKPLPVPGARGVRISSDGAAAYVVANRADGDHLVAIDLCAPGGPRIAESRKLAHHGALLATSMDAPMAAVVGDGEVTMVSTRDPRAPALFEPLDLPMGAKAPRAIELSPDGKLLTVLVADGNRLVALDVSAPPNSSVVTSVDLLPDQKLPLVRDLAFSSDGETLWIVSGDNERSLPALQPTRLTAVRILPQEKPTADSAAPTATEPKANKAEKPKNERIVSVWRTQSVPGAAAPIHIAVARGQPLASGTTIRMPPEKAAVFVASLNDVIFKLATIDVATPDGQKAALKLWHPPQPSILVRADINGGGGPLYTTADLESSLDLTPDAQLLVTTAARVRPAETGGGLALDFGVIFTPIWGTAVTPSFIPLEKLSGKELRPPFFFGEVRIQP